MPREISDEEYAYLMGRKAVADYIEPIWNDPALGKEAKRLVKKKYPDARIPDLEIEDKVEERFAAEDKKRKEEADKATRERNEKQWKAQRAKVQKEYGFTDDAMKDLEAFMIERNVGDYEVAARFKAPQSPRASEPTSHHGEPWGYGRDTNETFKEIAKDPEAWGRSEIMKALKADQDRARQVA